MATKNNNKVIEEPSCEGDVQAYNYDEIFSQFFELASQAALIMKHFNNFKNTKKFRL